jgi:hypothetical protein
MKKIGLLSSVLLLAGGLAFAQQPSTPGSQPDPGTQGQKMEPTTPADPAGQTGTSGEHSGMKGTHDKTGAKVSEPKSSKKETTKFTADVVSVDAQANTITVKRAAAADVSGKASTSTETSAAGTTGSSGTASTTGTTGTSGTSSTSGTAGMSGTASAGMSAGAEETLNVDSKAQGALKKVSAGDHVKIEARTDAMGKQIVTKIERVDMRPASGEKP